ncbi:MAG: protoheme IX farnesyltransferase [Gammaproteobacteria bacterium]|nr:MAG: protoheme IX farnesyltransferase [Gammaproteobacteria bacterium]
MIKRYLSVTKPGIVIGNLVAAIAGYMLAAKGDIEAAPFLAMTIGIGCVIASGCVFNNVVDRDIDGLMRRTRNRVMVRGLIPIHYALIYATVLGVTGFAVLAIFNTVLALVFALLGFVVYVGFYTLHFKRESVFGTLIGSISGACPPVVGYCAASSGFDVGALVLLVTFCLWQIPHSYAIAIYRFTDYKAAKIPVLPIVGGVATARKQMIAYIAAYTMVALALFAFNYVGYAYAILTTLIGLLWLGITVFGYRRYDSHIWARQVFIVSIIAIVSLSAVISTDYTSAVQPVANLVAMMT